ncbi:hypothetical protein GCK72_001700 [Caenorhabditis remanei]|uniref:Uncharacterized protein n=1 Tax=Caenorhabditis remanei TaxID=31234 RepID=A0A6A5HUG8_CAERE|nr:hypothetical protein GCK72_001700 [Caenorhabditis remanei]KAF1769883.1 hypothetical protein GCK72_001700 [Caenorhabditis remanei]
MQVQTPSYYYAGPTQMKTYTMPMGYTVQSQNGENQVPILYHRYVLTSCPLKKTNIAGVNRQNGSCYFYKYSAADDTMKRHLCRACQQIVEERHLSPLYVQYCEATKDTIIFFYNCLTNSVEQYTYSFKTGAVMEVFRPEIVYDRSKVIYSTSVAVLKDDEEKEMVSIEKDGHTGFRKQILRNGRFEIQPPKPIKKLKMKKITPTIGTGDETDFEYDDEADNSENSQYSDGGRVNSAVNHDLKGHSEESKSDDDGFSLYLRSIVPLKARHCPHMGKEYICAFNASNEKFSRFMYNDYTGEFQLFNCISCVNHVCEENLIPKYVENTNRAGGIVMHVENNFTGAIEQYRFNFATLGFEQILRPEFPYDRTKIDPDVTSLFVITTTTTIAVMKDKEGHLKKEQYCMSTHKFIPAPPVAVKTIFMMRREEQEREEKSIMRNKYSIETSVAKPRVSTVKRIPEEDYIASSEHLTHNQRPLQQAKLLGSSPSTTVHMNQLNEMLDMIHVLRAKPDHLPTIAPVEAKPVDMKLVASKLNKLESTQHVSAQDQPEKVSLGEVINQATMLTVNEPSPATHASAAKKTARKEKTKTSQQSSHHDAAVANSMKEIEKRGQSTPNPAQITKGQVNSSPYNHGFVNWEEFLRTNPTPAEVLAVIETKTAGTSKKSTLSKKASSKK